jgi:hypothetical protein
MSGRTEKGIFAPPPPPDFSSTPPPGASERYARIQRAVDARMAEHRAKAAAIKARVDAVLEAQEGELLDDLVRSLGGEPATDGAVEARALELAAELESFAPYQRVRAQLEGRASEEDAVTPSAEPSAASLPLPLLRAASRSRPLLVVGGTPVPGRLAWLERLGLRAEWEATEAGGSRHLKAVETRLANGSACAVVLLNSFLGEAVVNGLKASARAGTVPCSFGLKGGVGQLDGALRMLEQALAEPRQGAPT